MKSIHRSSSINFVFALLIVSFSAGAAEPSMSTSTSSRRDWAKPGDRPKWAVELAAAPWTFGGQSLVAHHPDAGALGTSLQVEYQPAFIQRYGTFGIGPVVAAYPISQNQGVTANYFSVWSYGAEVRYQARYSPKQFLVPTLGYGVSRMSYAFNAGAQGAVNLAGPMLGLQFLLNSLDSRRSDDFYEASGISHCYLVGELRQLTGSDGSIEASGPSWYFGMRFEM